MTYDLFGKSICSPGSEAGRQPFARRGGATTTSQCGPHPALASLSARQAEEAGLLTSGTFGPPSITLPRNAALMSFLASRLHRKTASLGSTLYRLTWKRRATPAGRSISALRASARPTSGSGSTLSGWPTPVAKDDGKTPEAHLAMKERMGGNRTAITSLQVMAQLSGWPTPMAGTPAQNGYNEAGNTDSGRKTVALAGWNTPRATGGSNGGPNQTGGALPADAALAGPARLTASGELLTGSAARMEGGGQLHPAHSLWLQGYPDAWLSCGVRAMQLIRKSPQASSKR
jgi:hypothetical protein